MIQQVLVSSMVRNSWTNLALVYELVTHQLLYLNTEDGQLVHQQAHRYHVSTNLRSVADPEGERGGTARSKIDQNLAELAHFVPILASMPP